MVFIGSREELNIGAVAIIIRFFLRAFFEDKLLSEAKSEFYFIIVNKVFNK